VTSRIWRVKRAAVDDLFGLRAVRASIEEPIDED
jgi:hypothetical protein